MSTTFAESILKFTEHVQIERGLSSATADKYDYRLNRFMQWMQHHLEKQVIHTKDIDLDVIRKFRIFLSNKDLKESTQYNYLVTIRSFLKYLVRTGEGIVEPEKVVLAKYSPSQSVKFLNRDQLKDFLEAPDTRIIAGLRDRALLELLFSTGLRVSELARLNRNDINFKIREFSIVGKGGRRRVVFLSDEAVEWVSKYLDRRDDTYVPLFLHYSGPHASKWVDKPDVTTKNASTSSKGSKTLEKKKPDQGHLGEVEEFLEDPDGERFRLSVRSIQRLVKKYAKKVGVAVDVTPHVLRHSFATDLLQAGADLRTVQESLGHKNVSTTQIYTHITNPQLKKAHEQFHGSWRKRTKEN
ncbi:hypothetical protein COX05_00250 [candidate division WWE3 bacterium CG22_combo_CG10-13_8_21_14_all_39_12]|uniref:Tyrosine recombinase XerC n=1 Tax=candidate division WWE3 bacterium CG22_combo_CG10-13_8_21_14_all_39_12 TaxID=1975094 RepID=A0A2H0BH14_UNCKA|nr:MAG: hypothetical protein COX05_00250 [candidate division WWE3 bacterium CG22_combo_CG10-13_8_21_14_all_39_12]